MSTTYGSIQKQISDQRSKEVIAENHRKWLARVEQRQAAQAPVTKPVAAPTPTPLSTLTTSQKILRGLAESKPPRGTIVTDARGEI